MNTLRGLCIAVALGVSVPALAAVDCSRAKTNSEKLLCSNSRLAAADQRMASAFRDAIKRGIQPEVLMDSQRSWIHDVRDVCNDVECMLKAYDERTLELKELQ
jgi:uncharacterized protein